MYSKIRCLAPLLRRRLLPGLLLGLLAGCTTTPTAQRGLPPGTDCAPESSAPMVRDLALDGVGLAADAFLPGSSLLLDATQPIAKHSAEPRVATTGTAQTPAGPIAYTLAGSGSPVLVLQSGLGDSKASWGALLAQTAKDHRVLAYDRPGYGNSPPNLGPRDPCIIAAELRALLLAVGVEPPYILVGHSLGGLYQYVYAKLYPQDVAGLILLDPTHPEHWQRMQRGAKSAAGWVKTLRGTVFTATQQREFDDQAKCLDRIDLKTPLTAPSRLLVRTRYEAIEQGPFETLVHTLEEDWQRLTGAPAVQRVCGSGHYIQREQPQSVIDALADLARTRGSRAPQ